ncbi:MAG: hypothetical protein ABR599_10515 [Gemmatimonadota bacterium]
MTIVTSFCPDGIAAAELVLDSHAALRVFYDLDTPVTLARLERGQRVDYLGERGLGDFDLVLSYTGGRALEELGALERLFLQPARSRPALRFLIGGSQYPQSFPGGENVWYTRHVPPQDHSAFYGSAGSR